MDETLDDLASACHAIAVEKGFWDSPKTPDFFLAKMALISSEVSEVLEAYRKEQGSFAIAEEFADIIIRTVDLFSGMQEAGIIDTLESLDGVIENKIHINANRERKHGNLI